MRNILINKPDYVINLRDLHDPKEIYDFFKLHKIKKCTYGFKCHHVTVKYGLTGIKDGGRGIFGERVRGQAAQLQGWTFNSDDLKIGKDILPVMQALNVTNKDYYQIEIWDLTNEPATTFDPDYELRCAESELLRQFEQEYKRLPIGNLRPEKKPTGVKIEQFRALFADTDA